MGSKGQHPEVVILGPDDARNSGDDSSRKVKFDETPHIVQPVDDNKLHSSSIPYRILSPNDDMSSPECADGSDNAKVKGHHHRSDDRLSDSASKEDGEFDDDEDDDDDDDDSEYTDLTDERLCGKYYSGDVQYPEGAEGLSPRDFDSGIHMSYCLSLEDDSTEGQHFRSSSQECLLSPESRKPQNHMNSKNSDSLDSLTSMSIHSLDVTNDTIDSLETHFHSGHNSPDIHNDFEETGASNILVGKKEDKPPRRQLIIKDNDNVNNDDSDDDDYNSVEIETMSLSRSSSEETLKTENEEDEREQEMILADFLDQLQDKSERDSSANNNNGSATDKDENILEKLDLSKFVPNDAKSRKASANRTLYRCNSHPEFNSSLEKEPSKKEELKPSDNHHHHHHSKSHKSKNVYKRSKSSDDFRHSSHKRKEDKGFHLPGLRNSTEEAEANDTVGDMQQMGEKTSPTNRFIRYDSLPLVVEVCEAEYTSPSHQVSDFRRLSIEYGMYDNTGSSDRSRKHRNRRMDWQRKFSPKNSQDDNDARQPSVESTTTEDTLPKSTSLSSAPTTPESDKWRRDSQALISSENESLSDSTKDHQKSPEKDINRLLSLSLKSADTKKEDIPDNRLSDKTTSNDKQETNDTNEVQVTRAFGKMKLMRSNRAVDEEITEKGLEINCNESKEDEKQEQENKDSVEDSDDNKTPTNSDSFTLEKETEHSVETSEKSVETDKVESHNENTQCEGVEMDCSSTKVLSPPTNLSATSSAPSTSCSPSPTSSTSATSGQKASHLPLKTPPSSPRTSPSNCRRKENLEIANLTKKVSMKQEEVLHSAEDVLSSANQVSRTIID